jgi:hypothetical protein
MGGCTRGRDVGLAIVSPSSYQRPGHSKSHSPQVWLAKQAEQKQGGCRPALPRVVHHGLVDRCMETDQPIAALIIQGRDYRLTDVHGKLVEKVIA